MCPWIECASDEEASDGRTKTCGEKANARLCGEPGVAVREAREPNPALVET